MRAGAVRLVLFAGHMGKLGAGCLGGVRPRLC
jgi:hypothetical protein